LVDLKIKKDENTKYFSTDNQSNDKQKKLPLDSWQNIVDLISKGIH